MKVTKTKLSAGLWEGVVSETAEEPALRITHLQRDIPGAKVAPSKAEGSWVLQVPIPASVIADGVQTIVISEVSTGQTLCHISFAAGEALEEDLRAEVDLLRAELELLKTAFRRHCSAGH